MREDGRFHSAHRDSIETLLRHLHQEVGRYETTNFTFCPVKGWRPFHISNLFILAKSEISIEAYVEGYTGIRPVFVDSIRSKLKERPTWDLRRRKGQSALWWYIHIQGILCVISAPIKSACCICSLTSRCSPKLGVILSGKSFKNGRNLISLASPPDFRLHFWMRCWKRSGISSFFPREIPLRSTRLLPF